MSAAGGLSDEGKTVNAKRTDCRDCRHCGGHLGGVELSVGGSPYEEPEYTGLTAMVCNADGPQTGLWKTFVMPHDVPAYCSKYEPKDEP